MKLIEKVITEFSVTQLKFFFRNEIKTFKPDEENYDYMFAEKEDTDFQDITKIGEADLSNSDDLIIISAKVLKLLTSKSGKKRQFEIAKKILKEENKDAAIFVFYDDAGSFRFSLIRANFLGAKRDFTDFKRFSYFVSKNQTNKTFKSQIEKADFNDLDSIQNAFSVEPLTKDFYEKIQHWYFWAIQNITFPAEPTIQTVIEKTGINDIDKLEPLKQEHKAQNVIRMLTRLLFVWFIKQKKLIPEELFDLNELQRNILKEIKSEHIFGLKQENRESIYYKAILQNLFFATLNCPIKPDSVDSRERGFRGDESYGKHRGIDYLMRYKKYFQNPDSFLELVNKDVPFLNGGLFECLDDKDNNIFIDGFSDNLPKEHQLIVPDYLFFGQEETTDLSTDLGIKNKKTKEASVMGLINILKSYNFTIDENEPNDIEVALDPELLGKVFENLLASYNPETKTTARKQTGSFYTPREIVNYMVDESLIAHLKNSVSWNIEEKELDEKLHQLISFSSVNPFENNEELSKEILHSLDNCKILDPACGSGAFPMGVLQKMVHILRKVDPENEYWYDIQQEKAIKETEGAFKIRDKKEREQYLLEINEAFDQTVNSPDYARKLFIIENCIYGVDIQPIAAQISKLRFFISLVVEQKVNKEKPNFGIRPLPNLETKFVTANTLIGIEKPKEQMTIFESEKVEELEKELKTIRHKLFGAKTKKTKLKYRIRDKELREQIAEKLQENGWGNEAAQQLAKWDPYDQNASSPFFDPEWMFDIKDGFDIVIGNPPYGVSFTNSIKKILDNNYKCKDSEYESYILFIEKGLLISSLKGHLCYIIPSNISTNLKYEKIRKFCLNNKSINKIVDLGANIFESASVDSAILLIDNNKNINNSIKCSILLNKDLSNIKYRIYNQNNFLDTPNFIFNFYINSEIFMIIEKIKNLQTSYLEDYINFSRGIEFGYSSNIVHSLPGFDRKPLIAGRCFNRYSINFEDKFVQVDFTDKVHFKTKYIYETKKIFVRRIGKEIIAYLDEDNYYNVCDVYNLLPKDNRIDLYEILGIINSTLINFYFRNFFKNAKILFPKIPIKYLKKIPIKLSNGVIGQLANFTQTAKQIRMVEESDNFESVIDGMVFNLYFPKHMKEREIDIIQFVEKDIEEVMKNRDFQTLNDSEKENVINELHTRWSDPNNEIVRRMSQFKEKSPDILKIILES